MRGHEARLVSVIWFKGMRVGLYQAAHRVEEGRAQVEAVDLAGRRGSRRFRIVGLGAARLKLRDKGRPLNPLQLGLLMREKDRIKYRLLRWPETGQRGIKRRRQHVLMYRGPLGAYVVFQMRDRALVGVMTALRDGLGNAEMARGLLVEFSARGQDRVHFSLGRPEKKGKKKVFQHERVSEKNKHTGSRAPPKSAHLLVW